MCGIAGIIRWGDRAGLSAEVAAMTAALAHRGPDGDGHYDRDGVALGHRRLAIIDLEGGRQPMCNEDESVWVTFNGEIYNFRELREQLEGYGHRFATRSDTEVLVHAYEQWGPESVSRLRGMFAFGIADFHRRRLFLARDHFGIKPLFYRRGGDYLAFASELAALRRVRDAAPRARLEAIDFFLRYRYVPAPGTVFEDVYQLPPASHLVVDFDGREIGPTRFWSLRFEPQDGLSDEQWLGRFEEVVSDSVRAHLVADVPFGVFLSGGIDSTLIAREMSDLLEQPVTAFSIGFEEDRFSELPYAKRVANRLGIELRQQVVRPDVADVLPRLIAHYGQPFADTSMIPTWHLASLARQDVPMVLSGDGGDEGFGGYPRYAAMQYGEVSQELRGLVRSPRGLAWRVPRILSALRSCWGTRSARWQHLIGCLEPRERRGLWRPEHRDLVDRPCAAFDAAAEQAAGLDGLTYGQSIDFSTYLPGDILTKVDVASMYHGLEVRTPLVDVRVVEFAATLPLEQRGRAGGYGPPTMKWLPKQALGEDYGADFVHRTKRGFSFPPEVWLRQGTRVRQMLDDSLADPRAPIFELFRPEWIRARKARMDRFRVGGEALWLLLVLIVWLEQNPGISFR